MIDHQGRKINLAWATHEIVWLRAAMQNGMQLSDLEDIRALSGRSITAQQAMARKLQAADNAALDRVFDAHARFRRRLNVARMMYRPLQELPTASDHSVHRAEKSA